ncbi:MAG: DUF3833 family protein [Proteobacteria bacterium]|nr:DUF3833 family protein [Pseudomonadota bacterium]
MKNLYNFFTIVLLSATLSSCAAIEKFKYKASEVTFLEKSPKIDIKSFFNGDVDVFAITQDNQGKIIGTYTAKMNGKWDDAKGILQQNFINEAGKKDSRTWLITVEPDGTFEAVGHNVVGPAKGKQVGNAMQMIYTLSTKHNEGKQNINYEDNFYLVDERSAISISTIRKDGSPSGRSIISYKKIAKTD